MINFGLRVIRATQRALNRVNKKLDEVKCFLILHQGIRTHEEMAVALKEMGWESESVGDGPFVDQISFDIESTDARGELRPFAVLHRADGFVVPTDDDEIDSNSGV